MRRVKLKPCPFCGTDDIMGSSMTSHYAMPHQVYWMECCACNTRGPEKSEVLEARNAWNRRPK